VYPWVAEPLWQPRELARLDIEVSAGWVSPSSRGLCGGHALLLSTRRWVWKAATSKADKAATRSGRVHTGSPVDHKLAGLGELLSFWE
jgi:hypothetical protein